MKEEERNEEQISEDDQALLELAEAMRNNVPEQEEKQNVHGFLVNVVKERDSKNIVKVGNLRDDLEMNELGNPTWNVRGSLEMSRIASELIGNEFIASWFKKSAIEVASTSLSREGFLIKNATTQTKQVANITKRRTINKGMFGSRRIEESGGDTTQSRN